MRGVGAQNKERWGGNDRGEGIGRNCICRTLPSLPIDQSTRRRLPAERWTTATCTVGEVLRRGTSGERDSVSAACMQLCFPSGRGTRVSALCWQASASARLATSKALLRHLEDHRTTIPPPPTARCCTRARNTTPRMSCCDHIHPLHPTRRARRLLHRQELEHIPMPTQ